MAAPIQQGDELHQLATAWRREMHQHPELGFEEVWTSDFVAARLAELGFVVSRGLGGTGVVASLKKGEGTRSVGLRADFDALPIEELTNLPYRSQTPGKMHACGHDGHTAMLLAAAKNLSENGTFDGMVNFIFQPAEEGGGGGRVMIEDGLFDQFPCDEVYAIHNYPGLPAGDFATNPGPVMAAADEFGITVQGKGGHAALPHNTVDPVPVAAQIITGLQALISRETSPLDSAVISCTMLSTNTNSHNVIPDEVQIGGTVRTLSDAVSRRTFARMEELAKAIATGWGASVRFTKRSGYPVTVNTADRAAFAANVARATEGIGAVDAGIDPMMAAEDFAYLLQKSPGAYVFIGNGAPGEKGSEGLHAATYDFNDAIIPAGVNFWTNLVEAALPVSAD